MLLQHLVDEHHVCHMKMFICLCQVSNMTVNLYMLNRLAQGVLSREEPEETFLKAVPGEVSEVHIVYPVSPLIPSYCLMYS